MPLKNLKLECSHLGMYLRNLLELVWYSKDSIKPPGAYLSETILWVGAYSKGAYSKGAYSKGAYSKGALLNVTALGSAKHNILCYFCPLKLLSHGDMTHIKHILNVDKGKGASKPNIDH